MTLRPAALLPAILQVGACGRSSDATAYLQASRLGPEAAAARCAEIGRPSLRDECLVFAARSAAEAEQADRVKALCAEVGTPMWRDECAFMCADAAQLVGGEARVACGRSGRYEDACLNHAVQRGVRESLVRFDEVGREGELAGELRAVLASSLVPAGTDLAAADELRDEDVLVGSFLAYAIAGRVGTGPFDAALCGVAREADCVNAYRVAMSGTRPEVARRACAGEPEPERLAAVGARPYTLGSESVAGPAWAAACAERARSGHLYDYQAVFGIEPTLGSPRPPPVWHR